MTVRSLCFYQARAVLSSASIVYTVPAGMTLIFKTVLAHNVGGVTSTLLVQLLNKATTTAPFVVEQAMTSGQDLNANIYHVLNSGDCVMLSTGGQPMDVWLSGSLLQGTAPIS